MCDLPNLTETFKNPDHTTNTINTIYTLYRGKKFCDVEINLYNKKHLAHSVVLAASSQYLNNKLDESNDVGPVKKIFLSNLNENAMLKNIEFCYTGMIDISSDTAANIMSVAGLFQIDPVVKSCCNFMKGVLSISNCLDFVEVGELYGCDDLAKSADEFITQNFKRISLTDQFLKIEYDHLERLLKKNLAVSSEYDIFESVKRWINHDSEYRKVHLSSFLKIIKLPLLSNQVISGEVKPLCQGIQECDSLVLEAVLFKIPGAVSNPSINWTTPRTSTNTLLVVGSLFAENARLLEIYDPVENKWKQFLDTGIEKQTICAVMYNDDLMIIGGLLNRGVYNTVESINLKTGKKRDLPPLQTHRFGAVAAVVGGIVYVIGGTDGSSTLDSVEKWDPESNMWTFSTPMITGREGCGVGVLGNEIFVVGGWNKQTNVGDYGLTTVEAFCPYTEKWRKCGSLNERRHWVSAAVAGNILYTVGGRLRPDPFSHRYKSVEIYNPKTDSWSFISDMNFGRCGAAVGSLDNSLVAIAGSKSKTVEKYDVTLNKWKLLAPLPTDRENSTVLQVPVSWLKLNVTLN